MHADYLALFQDVAGDARWVRTGSDRDLAGVRSLVPDHPDRHASILRGLLSGGNPDGLGLPGKSEVVPAGRFRPRPLKIYAKALSNRGPRQAPPRQDERSSWARDVAECTFADPPSFDGGPLGQLEAWVEGNRALAGVLDISVRLQEPVRLAGYGRGHPQQVISLMRNVESDFWHFALYWSYITPPTTSAVGQQSHS